MSENKEIQKAKEEYDKVMSDEHEKMLIRLREKYWLDYNSMKHASYDKGEKAGIEKRNKTTAWSNGAKEKQVEIAKKMIKMNMDIGQICEVTGLTKEEIDKL